MSMNTKSTTKTAKTSKTARPRRPRRSPRASRSRARHEQLERCSAGPKASPSRRCRRRSESCRTRPGRRSACSGRSSAEGRERADREGRAADVSTACRLTPGTAHHDRSSLAGTARLDRFHGRCARSRAARRRTRAMYRTGWGGSGRGGRHRACGPRCPTFVNGPIEPTSGAIIAERAARCPVWRG